MIVVVSGRRKFENSYMEARIIIIVVTELTIDPEGLNLASTGLATTSFFLKKSKSIVMRAGLVDMVAVDIKYYLSR